MTELLLHMNKYTIIGAITTYVPNVRTNFESGQIGQHPQVLVIPNGIHFTLVDIVSLHKAYLQTIFTNLIMCLAIIDLCKSYQNQTLNSIITIENENLNPKKYGNVPTSDQTLMKIRHWNFNTI